MPIQTAEVTGMGVLNCLEAVGQVCPDCRFYQASSSEIFGNTGGYLDENSPMNPESPYAVAKLFGHHMARVYRRSYGMFVSCGILFNTESPLRGDNFVTRKITRSLAQIKHGISEKVHLGNVNACRDWGFAGDSVRAMHMILQAEEPEEFVIATGHTNSVDYFLTKACEHFDLEKADVLYEDPSCRRPKDVEVLLGDSTKLRKATGWEPTISIDSIISMMCQHDYWYYNPDASMRHKADKYLFPESVKEG